MFSVGARRISSHHLRQVNWYLDHKTDSTGFFSQDTLRFITPYPMWKIVAGNPGDTLHTYPVLLFEKKDEFKLQLPRSARNAECYQGKFKAKNSRKSLALDLYRLDPEKPSDFFEDWIKDKTLQYRVIDFSTANLTLVKE
jgi:hypothetical protein